MTSDRIVHSINTPEPEAREKFLAEHGVTMYWEHMGGDPTQGQMVEFRFVMKRMGRDDEAVLVWEEFPYGCGCGLFCANTRELPYKVTKPIVPEVENFLECIKGDVNHVSLNQTFEDFAGECGYDEDSREAYKIWQSVQKEWTPLQRMLGPDAAREFAELDIEDKWR